MSVMPPVRWCKRVVPQRVNIVIVVGVVIDSVIHTVLVVVIVVAIVVVDVGS